MVAVKTNQVDSFVKSLDPALIAFVVYGPDTGRIGEIAATIARTIAAREDPPGEVLRIEEADLDDDPDRLLIELQTIPMFGGGKVIRTTTGRRINANMLKPIFEGAPPPAALVIEAGNLKPTDAIRKAAEKLDWAAALPCYADTARSIADLIDDVVKANGQAMSREARTFLTTRLGADRALSRNEIEKLSLYVGDRGEITEADIEAIIGDASAVSLDNINLAVMAGRTSMALGALNQAWASGQTAQSVLLALQRHFLMLQKLGGAIAGGQRLDDAIRGARPPIHFSVRDQVQSALGQWRIEALNKAVARIQWTIQQTRLQSALETALTERLALELAQLGRPRGRQAAR